MPEGTTHTPLSSHDQSPERRCLPQPADGGPAGRRFVISARCRARTHRHAADGARKNVGRYTQTRRCMDNMVHTTVAQLSKAQGRHRPESSASQVVKFDQIRLRLQSQFSIQRSAADTACAALSSSRHFTLSQLLPPWPAGGHFSAAAGKGARELTSDIHVQPRQRIGGKHALMQELLRQARVQPALDR